MVIIERLFGILILIMICHKKLLLSLIFLFLYAGATTFVIPPFAQSTQGETLDLSCAPGDVNCGVLLSSGWGLIGNT
jgi:hypothetical protein